MKVYKEKVLPAVPRRVDIRSDVNYNQSLSPFL